MRVLRKCTGYGCLALAIYMGLVIVVHAQNRYVNDQNREEMNHVETELSSDTTQIANLDKRVENIEEEKLDARISVIENSMGTSLKLQIGICLAMIPILLDIFRRWGRGRAQRFEVETDTED